MEAYEDKILAQHWTRIGVFEIRQCMPRNIQMYYLSLSGRRINGEYTSMMQISKAIARGDHDSDLVEPGASLKVPEDYRLWNGFR
jgi:hypothetical protein